MHVHESLWAITSQHQVFSQVPMSTSGEVGSGCRARRAGGAQRATTCITRALILREVAHAHSCMVPTCCPLRLSRHGRDALPDTALHTRSGSCSSQWHGRDVFLILAYGRRAYGSCFGCPRQRSVVTEAARAHETHEAILLAAWWRRW